MYLQKAIALARISVNACHTETVITTTSFPELKPIHSTNARVHSPPQEHPPQKQHPRVHFFCLQQQPRYPSTSGFTFDRKRSAASMSTAPTPASAGLWALGPEVIRFSGKKQDSSYCPTLSLQVYSSG